MPDVGLLSGVQQARTCGKERTMTLKYYRDQLDEIDGALEDLFIRRMQIVAKIGEYKAEHGLSVLDSAREAQVLEKHTAGIDKEMKPCMEEFFKSVMAISRSYQDLLKLEKGTEKPSGY